MCLKIWYMPLKPVDIHNNIMYTGMYICGMFPFAKPPIGLILHTCICIHISITPKKTGLNCGSMTCPTGGTPNINYGNNNYGKTGQSALTP